MAHVTNRLNTYYVGFRGINDLFDALAPKEFVVV